MALRCLQLYSVNPWASHVSFHETGSGPEGGAGETSSALDTYKKDVVEKLASPDQKKILNGIIDAAKKSRTDIATLLPILQVTVDTLKAAESYSAEGKAAIDAKFKEITKDGALSGAEVRELAKERSVEDRHDLNEAIADSLGGDAYTYLRKADGNRIQKNEVSSEYQLKNGYTIDFGIGEAGVDQDKANAKDKVMRLDQLVPTTTNVTSIYIESAKYGNVDLVRSSDGRFREVGKTTKDKWFFIHQGDKITITGRSDTHKAESTKADAYAQARAEEQARTQKEAADRQAILERNKAQIIEQNYSLFREAAEYTEETKVHFPEELQDKTGDRLAEMLPNMEYNEQLLTALKTLSQIQGKNSSPVGLLEEMRTRHLSSRNSLSFKEITKTVLGLTPTELKAEYDTLAIKEVNTPKESARKDQLEKFYAASASLMNALEKTRVVDVYSGAAQGISPEFDRADESMTNLEDSLDLFFDRKSEGPVADPTLWQGIRGQYSHEITMDYSENKAYHGKAAESRNYTQAAAWEYLRSQSLTYENGVATYQPKLLLQKLNECLFLGKTVSATREDYEKIRALPPLLESDLADLKNNPNYALYKEVIQLGFGQSLEADKPIENRPDSPATLSAEVIKAAHLSPEEVEEAQSRLKNYQILTLGALVNTEEGITELGANAAIPLTKDGRLTMNAGFRENIYHQEFELHVGPNVQVIHTDRINLNVGAGVSVNPGGDPKLSVGTGLEVGLGKEGTEHTWNLNVGIGGGLDPKTMGLALSAYLGVSRDLQAILAKHSRERVENGGKNIEQALSDYKKALDEAKIPEEEQAALIQQMGDSIKKLAGEQSMDAMKDFQFTGAGVSLIYVPGLNMVVPMPYFNFALKGNPYTMYENPHIDMDAVAKKQLQAAARETLGAKGATSIEVYASGYLMENDDGRRVLSQAQVDVNLEEKNLAGMNAGLQKQGLKLERNAEGDIMLIVSNARGNVDLYVDPTCSIEAYPTKDGHLALNLGTTDQLALQRVDEWSMFKRENKFENTKIYVSNTLKADPQTIRETTDKHLHFEADRDIYTSAVEMRDQGTYKKTETNTTTEGRTELSRGTTFESEEALKDSGLKTMLMSEDYADRKTALASIREWTRTKNTAPLSAETESDISAAVDRIMMNKDLRLKYKEVSTYGTQKELLALLKRDAPELDLNNEKILTTFLQKIMEASLLELDLSDPKKVEKELAWNRKRITTELQLQYSLDEVTASRIASTWVDRWAAGALSPTPIRPGTQVSIAVGTEGLNGTRSTSWNKEGNILGEVDLRHLEKSGLTAQDAQLLKERYDAATLLGISQNPFDMQLGIALLDRADLFFDAEDMKSLLSMAKGGPDVPGVKARFSTILRELYTKGSWTSPDGNATIKASLYGAFGLYEKCLNFTEVSRNTLKISVKVPNGTAISAQSREFLESHEGVEFVGLGVAVGVRTPGEVEEKPAASEDNSVDELDSASEGDPVAPGNESDDDHFGS